MPYDIVATGGSLVMEKRLHITWAALSIYLRIPDEAVGTDY